MLLGLWKNVEDLENSLNLEELEAILKAARDKEQNQQKFLAAIEGIKLDDETDAKTKVEEMKRRAEARIQGKTEEELDFADLGIEIEVD